MSNLRTDYKDDVFTGSRKYHTINNPDGTVSFTDETEYEQNGDTYGAAQINEVNDIINNLDASAYRSTDSVENALADNDYLPFYDTSASASKKTAWSNIKSLLSQLLAIKVHNSNSAGTYGAGNASSFGHVKLSDNYTSSAGNASQSVGASSQAAYNAYNTANTNSVNRYNDVVGELTANNRRIYMDYKNGKYGYNTSANRGADTFFPFKSVNAPSFLVGTHTVWTTPPTATVPEDGYLSISMYASVDNSGARPWIKLYKNNVLAYYMISDSPTASVDMTLQVNKGDVISFEHGVGGSGVTIRWQEHVSIYLNY